MTTKLAASKDFPMKLTLNGRDVPIERVTIKVEPHTVIRVVVIAALSGDWLDGPMQADADSDD